MEQTIKGKSMDRLITQVGMSLKYLLEVKPRSVRTLMSARISSDLSCVSTFFDYYVIIVSLKHSHISLVQPLSPILHLVLGLCVFISMKCHYVLLFPYFSLQCLTSHWKCKLFIQ